MDILKALSKSLWRLGWRWRSGRSAAPGIGERFPDFSLDDLQGTAHRLSAPSKAEHTVLWLTNLCEDCRAKAPLLEELRLELGDKARVWAISLSDNEPELTREVAGRCGFPLLPDPRDVVGRELGLAHPPRTCPLHNLFILDKDRRVVFRHHLSALDPETLRALWRGWKV